MKNLFFACVALIAVLFFSNMNPPEGITIMANSKDTMLADWQSTSGEVELHKTASKQCFTIVFAPTIFHPRDSIAITFTSYQVALTGLNKGTTVADWKGKSSLVYYINANWVPIVSDTNNIINQTISGKTEQGAFALKNYMIRFAVPLSRTLTITSSNLKVLLEMADGHGNPISSSKEGPTFTTTIKGIEVRKLEYQ